MDILFPFDENKLKPYLKMAVQRIKISVNKKSTQSKQQKRDIVVLLNDGKEEMARIKVESMISTDFLIESLSIVELMCELVHERIRYISSQKQCPADLLEAISSLVYAADKLDVDELQEVKRQFTKKYGAEFTKRTCIENADGKVNDRLVAKLQVQPPSSTLVNRYLEEIAKESNINWTPSSFGAVSDSAPVNSPSGFSIPMAPGSEIRTAYQRQPVNSNLATTSNNTEPEIYPNIAVPVANAVMESPVSTPQASVFNINTPPPTYGESSFDDLQSRFSALQNATATNVTKS